MTPSARTLGRSLAAGAVPAVILGYLALRGGGYADRPQQETAIVLCYAGFLGLVLGFLPRQAIRREVVVGGALLLAFAAWTGLSVLWSGSKEDSFRAFDLAMLYFALYVFVVMARSDRRQRNWLGGLTVGIVAIAALAAFSRMHPAWFPNSDITVFLPDATARLSYPVGYWNGLAFIAAAGVPLLTHFCGTAERRWVRVAAGVAIPVCVLTSYLTYSRAAMALGGAAIVLYLVLSPARRYAAVSLALAAGGAAVLIAKVHASPELAGGLTGTARGGEQGTSLLLTTVVVLLVLAAANAAYHSWVGTRPTARLLEPRTPRPGRRRTILVAVVSLLLAGAGAAFATGAAQEGWKRFKDPNIAYSTDVGGISSRLTSASSHGRYFFWKTSLQGFKEHPILGSGAATWEYLWARRGELPTYTRNSHSLYMDTLPELGIVGFLLVLGLVFYPLAVGFRRWRTASGPEQAGIAALLTVVAFFALAMGVDWVWRLPAAAAVFVIATGLLLSASGNPPGATAERPRRQGRYSLGVAVATLAWVAAAGQLIALISDTKVSASQRAVRQGNPSKAQSLADTAEKVEPWASAPRVQMALVQAMVGQNDAAIKSAQAAIDRGRANWRNWYALSVVLNSAGQHARAARALDRARSLNPKSKILRSLSSQ